MDNHYNHFKKIDAHSHIGKFGSPFNIDFDLSRLTEQMEEYNIEKTILCPAGCHLNKELKEAYQAAPDKIIPLCWVNANEGQEAYDMLEHYLRDENFAGVKMQPLFDAFTADSPMVDPIMEIAEAYKKPVFMWTSALFPAVADRSAGRAPSACADRYDPYGTRTWCLYRRQSEHGVQI